MSEEIKSREDLYRAVWSKPMMKLAEEFEYQEEGWQNYVRGSRFLFLREVTGGKSALDS